MSKLSNEKSPKKHFSTIPKPAKEIVDVSPIPPRSTSYETFIRGPNASLVVVNTNALLEKQPMISSSTLSADNQSHSQSSSGTYNVTDKIDFAALILFLSLYIIFNCLYVVKYV